MRVTTSKAISKVLSIVIVIAIILVAFAGYSGYVAGIVNRQTTTVTQSQSPNVTITEVIVEEQINTISGCVGFATFTNSTTYILPSTVTGAHFYATVTTQISQTSSTVTASTVQIYTTVINGTTHQQPSCV